MNNNEITLSSAAISLSLAAFACLLILVSFSLQFLKYHFGIDVNFFLPLFDVSLEQNLPTYFSVILLLFSSLCLAVIATLKYRQKADYTSKWWILSLGFLYMAYDEGFHVHEDLVAVVRPLLGDGRLGIFYYAWVIPGMIVVLFLFLYFFRFLISLPTKSRILFIAAASVYLTGCIGMELVGGYYDELHGMQSLKYNLISTVEEGLEMAGIVAFIYALLDYVSDHYHVVRLNVTR